jgi:hypothetical protein
MIEFATLFLSLVTGIHPVEVVVSDPVTSVEIILDGQTVGVIEEPPWRITCNFGRDPLPHELIAIARDTSDETVATARQLVNLPRSKSEVRLVLLDSQTTTPSAVRLIIGNPLFVKPFRIAVELDGSPITIETPDSISLPDYDPTSAHIITAEVEFTDGSAAHTAISFSRGNSGLTETELTAVPVAVDEGLDLTLDSTQNLFSADGRSIAVHAIERSGGRVVMVRDHEASEHLARMGQFRDGRISVTRQREIWADSLVGDGRGLEEILFRTVVPIPIQSQSTQKSLQKAFWVSPFFRVEGAGLDWCASHVFPRPDDLTGGRKDQQVADAVAMAGLQAAGSGRPRVVVLVVGDQSADASLFGIESTKRFLRALNVPLVVWMTHPSAAGRWGNETLIKSPKQFIQASNAVIDILKQQRIVWLEGMFLPGDVTLDPKQNGIRIAAQ